MADDTSGPVIGLVLVTHGQLAAALRAALEHVVGPLEGVATVCIDADDDMETRRRDILAGVRGGRWPGRDRSDRHVRRHALQFSNLNHGQSQCRGDRRG